MTRSVASKLVLRVSIGLLLAQVVWVVPSVMRTRARTIEKHERLVDTVTAQLRLTTDVPGVGVASIRKHVETLSTRDDLIVTLLDAEGAFVAGSPRTPSADRAVSRAKSGGTTVRQAMEAAIPVKGDGFIFVAVPAHLVFREWTNDVLVILIASLVAVLVAGLLCIQAVRQHVLRPISQIIQAAVNRTREREGGLIAEKDTPDDELGDVIRGQNETLRQSMAYQKELRRKNRLLRRERRALRKWGTKLERRVQQKTDIVERAREQLVQSGKLTSLAKLAASVAGEVYGPLAAIAESAEALLDTYRESDDLGEILPSLQHMHEQAIQGREIARRLMDLAQETDLVVEEVDANALADIEEDAEHEDPSESQ